MSITLKPNYSEVVIFQSKYVDDATGWQVIETNLDESRFAAIMQTISKDRRLKFFEKEFKSYTIGNVICENRGNQDIRVFQRVFVRADIDDPRKLIRMHYDMSKIPYHQFPSTMHIHDISYVKRMSAKVHNRVSIHFETSVDPKKNKIIRRIFASCSSEGNVEMDNLEAVLESLVKEMSQMSRMSQMSQMSQMSRMSQ